MQEKIIEYLKSKYQAKMILLGGSRARGEEDDYSDWDVYVFTADDIAGGRDTFEGQYLDVNVIKLPVAEDFYISNYYAPPDSLAVLYDDVGIAGGIVTRTAEKYSAGPEKLSTKEYKNRLLRSERMVLQCERHGHDPEILFAYAAEYYEMAMRYWLELRQQWPQPPEKALPYIETEDDAFYQVLISLSDLNDVSQKAQKIHRMLFARENAGK